MNGDELTFTGPISQLESDRWIQNMEDHMENNTIAGKIWPNMLFSALKEVLLLGGGCTKPSNGWQRVTTWEEFKLTLPKYRFVSQELKPYGKDMKKPCACKLYGEIGHNHKDHKDECPNCEGSHPAEECPTRQITSFLCGGTTHYPTQCHIYPMVQRTI